MEAQAKAKESKTDLKEPPFRERLNLKLSSMEEKPNFVIVRTGKPIPVGNFIFETGTAINEKISVNLKTKDMGDLYKKAKDLASVDGKVVSSKTLGSALSVVANTMPKADRKKIAEIVDNYLDIKLGDDYFTVPVDDFIKAGVGECRHKASAVAGLLVKFKQEGHLTGDIFMKMNFPLGEKEGHVWVEYQLKSGATYVVDAEHKFFGRYDPVTKELKGQIYNIQSGAWEDSTPRWKYEST